MEVQVKVISKLDIVEGVSKSTGKEFKYFTFIGETIEQYPRKIAFEAFGDKRIENCQVNENEVYNVSFDVESREFNGRWFTKASAWKTELVSSSAMGEKQQTQQQEEDKTVAPIPQSQAIPQDNSLGDDYQLPF